MTLIHDRPDKKDQRRALRQQMTPAEATLWRALKGEQLGGYRFRRQHSIGPYIVDFYCPAVRLIVELDGAGHFTASGSRADDERSHYLQRLNFRILRIENRMVWSAFSKVLEAILAACHQSK